MVTRANMDNNVTSCAVAHHHHHQDNPTPMLMRTCHAHSRVLWHRDRETAVVVVDVVNSVIWTRRVDSHITVIIAETRDIRSLRLRVRIVRGSVPVPSHAAKTRVMTRVEQLTW